MSEPTWEERIRQQAGALRKFPQLQAYEQACTSLCKIIIDDINELLVQKNLAPIPAEHSLPCRTPRDGGPSRFGFYHTVQFLLGDAVFSYSNINDRPLAPDTVEKLGFIMRHFTAEEHTHFITEFHKTHHQLESVPELATYDKLYAFIDKRVNQCAMDWLTARPSNPMPEPPKGRSV